MKKTKVQRLDAERAALVEEMMQVAKALGALQRRAHRYDERLGEALDASADVEDRELFKQLAQLDFLEEQVAHARAILRGEEVE